jgi:hypothetical protein
MSKYLHYSLTLAAAVCAAAIFAKPAEADPLPGRDLLKFGQEPMIATQITNTTGQVNTYWGHDELSTAYGFSNNGLPPTDYSGKFMADDFSDNFSAPANPVVHVKWWGSYMDNNNAAVPPQAQVQKFLIAFEDDVPAGPSPSFSTPGTPLQYDVVTIAPSLTAGSGNFTEKLVPRAAGDPLNEALYEYNAELHFNRAFQEQAGKVYWLKIAALVDAPPGVTFPVNSPPPGITKWGWHNRDYTIQDTLASAVPTPGESVVGTVDGTNVWHFQDDSVQGDLRFLTATGLSPSQAITQNNMVPQNYVSINSQGIGPLDGPSSTPGTTGIDTFSKDLAFRLYTTQNVPEPAACMLMAIGLAGVFATRRRSQTAK